MIECVRNFAKKILEMAVYSSNKEAGRQELVKELQEEVEDLTKQYTTFDISTPLQVAMVRCLHAFQVELIQITSSYRKKKDIDVVDIGDSSGTHLKYLQREQLFPNVNMNALSVNLDPEAVRKIQENGLKAIHCRAEELVGHPEYKGRNVDMFLSFETLEHLFNPISFLKAIADSQGDAYFVLTVPYIKKSRVALHQIRDGSKADMYAENTHIFELSPEDWKLLFQLSGWKVEHESIFRLFPRKNILVLASLIWKRFKFDGHYGCVLSKDDTFSNRYKSWD